MREWSLRRILWTSGLVQAGYMLLVSFVPLPVPVSPDALLVSSGTVGGLLAGVFLSRLPIGDRWSNGANFWDNAAGYGAVAAILGTIAYFSLLAVYNLAVTWQVNGVFAPQIVFALEFIMLLFHSGASFISGGLAGIVGLSTGNLLEDLRSDLRPT